MSYTKGFTLIELVIVIVVLSLLSFLFGAFITNTMDAYVFVKVREKGLSDARLALTRMTRELKAIKKPQHIITMTTTECKFVKVTEGVVKINQVGTDIYMQFPDDPTTTEGETYVLLSDLVSPEGLSFFYYDISGNPASVGQDVRKIKVRVHMLRANETLILESSAKIRNL